MSRNQAADAQTLYDARSASYDAGSGPNRASWHGRFARHTVELASITAGERVLDLACGTGLLSFAALEAVTSPSPLPPPSSSPSFSPSFSPSSSPSQSQGHVTAIDISGGMLAQAQLKRSRLPPSQQSQISIHQHSITALSTLPSLDNATFDVITCCAALVLLPSPAEALRTWTSYLRPGGRLVVDVPHARAQTAGIVFERVGRRLDRPVAWYRTNFEDAGRDLSSMMEGAGLVDVQSWVVSQRDVPGTDNLEDYLCEEGKLRVEREFEIEDADQVFEARVNGMGLESLAGPDEVRERAKAAFREEWARMADGDGKIREIDGVYVCIGWKP